MNASLSTEQLALAAALWPKSFFKSEESWLTYVNKWYPIVTKKK